MEDGNERPGATKPKFRSTFLPATLEIDSRNRVTIPVPIRRTKGIKTGDEVRVFVTARKGGEMFTAKVYEHGRIILPKRVRRKLGIGAGETAVFWVDPPEADELPDCLIPLMTVLRDMGEAISFYRTGERKKADEVVEKAKDRIRVAKRMCPEASDELEETLHILRAPDSISCAEAEYKVREAIKEVIR